MTLALVVVGLWRQVPYVMILYLAGQKNVPEELVEAATMNGANWGQRFRHVVLPMLATVVEVTISVIDSLRSFDIVYVMINTKARAAEVLASYMYSSAFAYQDYGYGSAIAVVQFLITFAFIVVYVSNTLKNEIQR
jgi:multiple sugar transport system permease protein